MREHEPSIDAAPDMAAAAAAIAPRDSGVSLSAFFDRCKLSAGVKDECDAFVATKFPGEECRPCAFQGYCSYTVRVGSDVVVQFRPAAYKLDLDVVGTAGQVFGALAPETRYLGQMGETGLHVYAMRQLPGLSLLEMRAGGKYHPWILRLRRENVVKDFARLQVSSWRYALANHDVPAKRTVGSSLRWRLESMAARLPRRFHDIVRSVLVDLPDIESLPWTFSHGDLLPSNVMVYPESGRIAGLLDWAEAEYLPFGVGMYGLEELLGEDKNGRFVPYPEADYLRKLYWGELLGAIPGLSRDSRWVALVKKAQVLGILLWHGIAFDDGRLNRVVEEGRDDAEVERLDAFLIAPSVLSSRVGRLRNLKMSRHLPFAMLRNFWPARQ